MDDNELYEQARARVQRKIKGRSVRNKDIIVDQEKEIRYYRERIQNISQEIKKQEYQNKFEIEINEEDYIIYYNDNIDIIMLNAYLVKLINEKDKYMIIKDNLFKIINKSREFEFLCFEC